MSTGDLQANIMHVSQPYGCSTGQQEDGRSQCLTCRSVCPFTSTATIIARGLKFTSYPGPDMTICRRSDTANLCVNLNSIVLPNPEAKRLYQGITLGYTAVIYIHGSMRKNTHNNNCIDSSF